MGGVECRSNACNVVGESLTAARARPTSVAAGRPSRGLYGFTTDFAHWD